MGLDDTLHALNTLFEVLFTLMRGLAPFAPFLTDNIYGRLLPHIPEHLRGQDSRSVHFLPYPDVKEHLFDEAVERRVGRMQRVIELGRMSRERRVIGLKTPLKSFVVLHHDAQYLDDIRSLERYVVEELNVRDLVLSSSEDEYGVRYSVTADWPTLGKKLKKDAQRVKKALPLLSSEQVRDFVRFHRIEVDGIELAREDLIVKRGLDESQQASANAETNTDDDVLTILDATIYPDLALEGLAREIINRVQKLRKTAGLVPTDDVRVQYRVLSDPDEIGLAGVFRSQAATLEKALRRPVEEEKDTEQQTAPQDAAIDGDRAKDLIFEEEQEVQNARFLLRLLKV